MKHSVDMVVPWNQNGNRLPTMQFEFRAWSGECSAYLALRYSRVSGRIGTEAIDARGDVSLLAGLSRLAGRVAGSDVPLSLSQSDDGRATVRVLCALLSAAGCAVSPETVLEAADDLCAAYRREERTLSVA